MAVWVVRGAHREEEALEEGLISIGYEILEDLRNFSSKDDLKKRLRQNFGSDAKPEKISNYAGKLFRFRDEIKVDDLLIMPRKRPQPVAFGKVAGDYIYVPSRPELCHGRHVSWVDKVVSKSRLGQDLYEALSNRPGVYQAILTKIWPTNAEERLMALVRAV